MITLARLKLLSSQKPGDEKNAYLLLSLTLLDFSREHLVSEDVTESKFPVRPLCTEEKKLLYPFMLSHGTLLMHCSCNNNKKTSCFFSRKASKRGDSEHRKSDI